MKFLVFALAIISTTSLYARNCVQNEAQFIGNVTELRIIDLDQGQRDCTFKIAFTLFNESGVCPLYISVAQVAELEDRLCSLELANGDEISGILIEKNGYIFIEE